MALAYGDPHYRIFVDPPFLGSTSSSYSFTLCFNEHDAERYSAYYCPLGTFKTDINGPDEPLQELALGEGSDTIPPAYPIEVGSNSETEFLGVGLFVLIIGTSNGVNYWYPRIGGAPGTETMKVTSTTSGSLSLTFTVTFRVYCVPEYTGLDCNTPISLVNNNDNSSNTLPTTLPPTTTLPATVFTTMETTQEKTTDNSK